MAESEEDKYQSLLNSVEELSFSEGAYIQLCDALKKVKESLNKITINEISIYIEFQIQNKFYTLFVVQQEIVDKISYLNYSIKCLGRKFDFKKEEVEAIEHIKKYLHHATDIKIVHNYDDKEINFTLEFKNIEQLNLYYSRKVRDYCYNCNTDDNECDVDHDWEDVDSLTSLFYLD